eukprot:5001885-Prymnesium_polylepis.2
MCIRDSPEAELERVDLHRHRHLQRRPAGPVGVGHAQGGAGHEDRRGQLALSEGLQVLSAQLGGDSGGGGHVHLARSAAHTGQSGVVRRGWRGGGGRQPDRGEHARIQRAAPRTGAAAREAHHLVALHRKQGEASHAV